MELGSKMDAADSPEPRPQSQWIALGGLMLLCVLLVAFFSQALESPLFSDDQESINQVMAMDSWTEAFQPDAFTLYRPIKNLFFYAMVHSDAGVARYHLLTLAAYLLATLGVYTLAQRLFESPLWGLAAAAIWSLSAANVTVGVWSSCFNISMAGVGMTFGLWAWDRWREAPGRHLTGVLSFACFALALGSYETAITMAPIAVLLDLYRGRKVFSKDSISRYAGIAALVAVYLLVRGAKGASAASVGTGSFSQDIENWQIAASAPYFLWTHFLMWVAPWGRLECLGSYLWDKSVPAIILPFCWILLIGGVSLGIRFWRAGNTLVFGLAWFFIVSFPSNNFIPLGNTPYADYYVTLPGIGLAIATVAILRALSRSVQANNHLDAATKRAAWVIIALILLSRAANLTAFQGWIQAWQTPAMVMAHTAGARPHQYLAKTTTSIMLVETGSLELAESYASSAIQDTEEFAKPYMVLGQVRLLQGKPNEAAGFFRTALDKRHLSQEDKPYCWLQLGRIYASDPKQVDQAFSYYVEILKRHDLKEHHQAVIETAEMYKQADRQRDRLDTLKRGLKIYPNDPRLLADLEDTNRELAEPKQEP